MEKETMYLRIKCPNCDHETDYRQEAYIPKGVSSEHRYNTIGPCHRCENLDWTYPLDENKPLLERRMLCSKCFKMEKPRTATEILELSKIEDRKFFGLLLKHYPGPSEKIIKLINKALIEKEQPKRTLTSHIVNFHLPDEEDYDPDENDH